MMQTDLLKAAANDESFSLVFPGGYVRLNRYLSFSTKAIWASGLPNVKPKCLVYLKGSFLADDPPPVDEPFGIQRYVAALCGMARVTRVSYQANCAPCRVEFESVGPVFGDVGTN
jgi:hypothetical protein